MCLDSRDKNKSRGMKWGSWMMGVGADLYRNLGEDDKIFHSFALSSSKFEKK